jgi:hypothetical protein
MLLAHVSILLSLLLLVSEACKRWVSRVYTFSGGSGVRTADDHELRESVASHCSGGQAGGWLCDAVRVVLECSGSVLGGCGKEAVGLSFAARKIKDQLKAVGNGREAAAYLRSRCEDFIPVES